MTMLPDITEPAGDPVGIRTGGRTLTEAGASLTAAAQRLTDSNHEVVRVWESAAQRVYSALAEGFAGVVAGTSDVAQQAGAALDRYAATLETCQSDVRLARYRLESLVASTPAGMLPDQAALAAIRAQVQQANAQAAHAARELAAAAQSLMGSPAATADGRGAADVNASFVSRTHSASAGLVDTRPAAAAFDAQAADIRQRMGAALLALAGLAAGDTRPVGNGLYPSQTIVGGSTFSSSIGQPTGFGTGPMIVGGTSFTAGITTGFSTGPMIIGGSTFSSNIGSPSGFGSGSMIIGGGPSMSDNPVMTIARAIENRQKRSAAQIWNSAFPGVPVPDIPSNEILSRLLRQAPNLTPAELAGIGIINDGIHYNIRNTLLPRGWELVREPRAF